MAVVVHAMGEATPATAQKKPTGHTVPVKARAAKLLMVPCEVLMVYDEPAVRTPVMVVPGATVLPVRTMPTVGVPTRVPAHESVVSEMEAVEAVADVVPAGQ